MDSTSLSRSTTNTVRPRFEYRHKIPLGRRAQYDSDMEWVEAIDYVIDPAGAK